MKKKYLKTVEDVISLKDTDTKIYAEKEEGCYYQFVKGVFCCFSTNNDHVCIGDYVTLKMNLYILEEEPVKEATEKDKGKLCKFWNDDPSKYMVGMLHATDFEGGDNYRYCVYCAEGCWYKHCRRLTPAEVAEITGYKVEE